METGMSFSPLSAPPSRQIKVRHLFQICFNRRTDPLLPSHKSCRVQALLIAGALCPKMSSAAVGRQCPHFLPFPSGPSVL